MISHLRIELASGTDAPAISSLSGTAIEHGLRRSWMPQRVLASIRNPDTNVAVAKAGARLVGFGIMDYDDERAHLALLAVAESRRRQGVGSSLLRWLEASALTAGIGIVRAEVRLENAVARRFYGARGYEEGERLVGYYQGIEDALRLEKKLSA